MDNNTTGARRAAQLQFLAIDERTGTALRKFWATVDPELPRILEAFYRHLGILPQAAAMVGQLAAAGTGEVSRNIAGVNETATRTGGAAGSVLEAARALGTDAGTLNQRVAAFFEQVRAA